MTETFDDLVIGGGSAGATLAGRLSADEPRRVLLIEAGGADRNLAIHVPGRLGDVLTNADLNWSYVGEPDPSFDGPALTWRADACSAAPPRSTAWSMGARLPVRRLGRDRAAQGRLATSPMRSRTTRDFT